MSWPFWRSGKTMHAHVEAPHKEDSHLHSLQHDLWGNWTGEIGPEGSSFGPVGFREVWTSYRRRYYRSHLTHPGHHGPHHFGPHPRHAQGPHSDLPGDSRHNNGEWGHGIHGGVPGEGKCPEKEGLFGGGQYWWGRPYPRHSQEQGPQHHHQETPHSHHQTQQDPFHPQAQPQEPQPPPPQPQQSSES
ncbi:uncharacterized protein LOC143039876 isoform X1 [Oratosquilla oratoria]|uniref:uncharacterized protein LOC143039876 isoform X1 n=1 Tax=Oratosquilla oratoria TaxID=337810 RepID=UPI003F75AD58